MTTPKALLILCVLLCLAACDTVIPIPPPPQEIREDPDRIIIVDKTGKEWDITTASRKYGLEADRFNYGLGPDAIPPLYFPEMLEEGDPEYPATSKWMLVIGAEINGDARAYKTIDLNLHEVVNEEIGGEYVFVGW